jgi:hypothetical protein
MQCARRSFLNNKPTRYLIGIVSVPFGDDLSNFVDFAVSRKITLDDNAFLHRL